jgi:maleylacetate reductase
VMLPHTAGFNAGAARAELQSIADLFGGDLGGGLWDYATSLGAPLALRDLGMQERDLDRAADLAVKNPYWNPRPVTRDAIRALLGRAWSGARPE